MFETVTEWAIEALGSGGSVGLALVMLIENLFPPIPSEVVLPLAGFFVSQGEFGFVQALVAATAGSVVGALLLYALGRWGGRPVLLRYRSILRLDEEQLDRADDWFDRYDTPIVFWARMVPLARSVVSVPAGAAEMPVGRFTLLTTAGSLIWNTILITAGLLLGENYQQVTDLVSRYSTAVLVLVVLAGVAGAVWLVRHYRQNATSGEPGGD